MNNFVQGFVYIAIFLYKLTCTSIVLVYAIEASDMAEQASVVIKSNKMQDRITVIHSKVEVTESTFNKRLSLILSPGVRPDPRVGKTHADCT